MSLNSIWEKERKRQPNPVGTLQRTEIRRFPKGERDRDNCFTVPLVAESCRQTKRREKTALDGLRGQQRRRRALFTLIEPHMKKFVYGGGRVCEKTPEKNMTEGRSTAYVSDSLTS